MVRELALLVWVNLLVELVGVDVAELETRVLLLVEQDPDAEEPPLARNPQSDLAQLLWSSRSTGLAGSVRFASPTVPRALLRVAARASVAIKPAQPTVAANKPMLIRRITPSHTLRDFSYLQMKTATSHGFRDQSEVRPHPG